MPDDYAELAAAILDGAAHAPVFADIPDYVAPVLYRQLATREDLHVGLFADYPELLLRLTEPPSGLKGRRTAWMRIARDTLRGDDPGRSLRFFLDGLRETYREVQRDA